MEIIQKMLRLWDPFELYIFPQDEYDSYAKSIHEFISNTEILTITNLTDFVYELLREGMRIKGSKDSYIEIEKLDKDSSMRFSELYFATVKYRK